MEITDIITKNHPNLKQKLEDIALYIKVVPPSLFFLNYCFFQSRESKNEHYENKIRAFNNELKNKQKVKKRPDYFHFLIILIW